jgi:hypothetical protein
MTSLPAHLWTTAVFLLGAVPAAPAWSQVSEAASASASASAAAEVGMTQPVAVPPVPPPSRATVSTVRLSAPNALLPVPSWSEMNKAQKQTLAPLERDWDELTASSKSKWLEVAARFPALPADEQTRLQERMRDWARLSPPERQQARAAYQVGQQLKTDARQAKWEAYQALPAERRQELADKAALKQAPKSLPPKAKGEADFRIQAKSNLIPAVPISFAVHSISPSVLQAKPGASTVLINQISHLPAHQQAGQTKVLADPDLVDSKTLLPKRSLPAAASR